MSEDQNSSPSTKETKTGWRGSWFVWLGVLTLMSLIAWGLVNNKEIKPQVGDPAPDFEMPLFTGFELENQSNISLAGLEGRVVVVNFWASWCVTCIYETEDLESVWQDYRDDGVVVLGVAYLDEESKSREFIAKYGMTYPTGADLRSQITSEKYFVSQVPETFVVGPDGNVAAVFIGQVSRNQLTAVIDPLLAAP